MNVLHDCRTCAACCLFPDPFSLELDNRDFARLTPAEQAKFTVFRGGRCSFAKHGERCAALEASGPRFACAVYERRPRLCREFEPGSPACEDDRALHRLPGEAAPRTAQIDGKGPG